MSFKTWPTLTSSSTIKAAPRRFGIATAPRRMRRPPPRTCTIARHNLALNSWRAMVQVRGGGRRIRRGAVAMPKRRGAALIVDDDVSVGQVLKDMVESCGYAV